MLQTSCAECIEILGALTCGGCPGV